MASGPPIADRAPRITDTLVSTVILMGELAYKVKKPVHFGFLDLRDREARRAACHREVELNRRLAPDVYLGVADVCDPGGSLCEHIVVMRRLPEEVRLSTLVRRGAPLEAEWPRLARRMAEFHREAPRSAQVTEWGGRSSVRRLWTEGLAELRGVSGAVLDPAQTDRVEHLAMRFLDGRGPLFAERQEAGRIVDGHGDLLAEDIFCLPDGPRILDCLEFDPRLRAGDVLADVAFLAMDLERLGAPEAARAFLDAYRECCGQPHPRSLVDHYIAYRAHVRAKVACLRVGAGDPQAAAEARQLSGMCRAHLELARVRLVLVGGPPGCGKTTVAAALGRDSGARVIGSDVVRKRLWGLDPQVPAGAAWQSGMYSPEHTGRTYAELLGRARRALGRGESVVLDATWGESSWRTRARSLAAETSSDLVELRCTLPDRLAATRLAGRRGSGDTVSDATEVIRRWLSRAADPWPQALQVDTRNSVEESAAQALALAGWGRGEPGV